MRARASSYVGLGWQLGVLAAAIVTPILLPVIGWRGMFMLGIFPAVAAYFIRNSLHEPEVFVKKSHDRPKESALHLLVNSVETTKLSLGMIILTSVQNFGYYGVMIWLPSYLSSRFGFALTQSAVWTMVTIAAWPSAFSLSATSPIAPDAGRLSSCTCWAPPSWWWYIHG
jgi:MFS family permease